MRAKSIAVIIRTRNESARIRLLLEALRSQTVRASNIIIVDSGSSDNTIQITREYGASIINISQREFTYGRALNYGFAASDADILVTLSGHAIPVDSCWLEMIEKHFANPRVAGVSSRVIPDPGSRPIHNYLLLWPFYIFTRLTTNNLWVFWNTAAAYRRVVWETLHFNEDLLSCEDREWALRARSLGYDVVYEPQAIVWHYHSESYIEFFHRSYVQTLVQFCLLFYHSINAG